MQQRFTIGWKVSTLNWALASLRYRAMFPLLALEGVGIKSKIFTKSNQACLADLDALIIVKSFTMNDIWLAQKAFELKIPVFFDLCDNIFIEQYGSERNITPKDIFLLIANGHLLFQAHQRCDNLFTVPMTVQVIVLVMEAPF